MLVANIYEAKTNLSRLIDKVSHGEEIIIAKAGKPIAKLVPYHPQQLAERKPGIWRGKVKIAKDFDELPDELLDKFMDD